GAGGPGQPDRRGGGRLPAYHRARVVPALCRMAHDRLWRVSSDGATDASARHAGGAMMSTMQGIHVQGVSRHFDGVKAVDDVSFSLAPGETLALVGPNGAGKSTLIQLISGIERLSGGHIMVDGRRIDRLPPERIARLGIGRSFQTSRVFPALSVWDSVMLGTQARLLRREHGRFLVNPLYELLAGLLPLRGWRKKVQDQEAIVHETLQLFGDHLSPR